MSDTGNLFNKRDKCEKCNGHGWYRIGSDEVTCEKCRGTGFIPLAGWARPGYEVNFIPRNYPLDPHFGIIARFDTVEEFLNSEKSHRWILIIYDEGEQLVFSEFMKDRAAFKKAYNHILKRYGRCYVSVGGAVSYFHDAPIVGAIAVRGHLFSRPHEWVYKPVTRED